MISCVILTMWAIAEYGGSDVLTTMLAVNPWAAGLAAVTAIVSLIGYAWVPIRATSPMALISYVLLVSDTMLLIITSGDTSSPFIALWMLVSVAAGLFGYLGLLIITVIAGGYLTYLMNYVSPGPGQLVVYVLAFLLPIAISYMIWHRKNSHENDKEKAYTALRRELTEVASQSDIVINAIADGVIAVNGQGIVQLINPAAQHITGWAAQDAIDLDYRSVLKLTDDHDQPLTPERDAIQQVLRDNHTVSVDAINLTTNSNKSILISLLVSPLGAPGAGAIMVFRDVTAVKSEERQQAEFISTASHEMRTPVAAIEGYLGLALNPATAVIDDKARAYLTKAHESAQHLGRLFQDLLDVSKAEDGRLNYSPGIIDMVGYVREIVTTFAEAAKAKGLVLVYKPDIDAGDQHLNPVFYCTLDPDHLREVISNLIENALKYTPQGDVAVDVTGDDLHVRISVSDTGLGIPPEDIAHLFQKFYRVDNTATREIGGTGLGLYLARRLVEAMGGRIWAESVYEKGSTFSMEFDRMPTEEAMTAIEQATEQQESRS